MEYYKIEIDVSEAGIEVLTGKLISFGILNTMVSDPRDVKEIMNKKESYEWDYIDNSVIEELKESPKITVFTEDKKDIDTIKKAVNSLKKDISNGLFGKDIKEEFFGNLNIDITTETDYSWQNKWKESFKPFYVAEGIVIKPSWENLTDDFSDSNVIIEMDPGMAFGTGMHETTSLCIEMIKKYMKKGDKVLDAGCGSGILSIAAAKLGADRVFGIDIDNVAVEVAKENVERNKVSEIVDAELGDITKGVDFKGNLVVANLMAELVAKITPDVFNHILDGGYYITSGILNEKEKLVKEALNNAGFHVIEIKRKGEWSCIVAKINNGECI